MAVSGAKDRWVGIRSKGLGCTPPSQAMLKPAHLRTILPVVQTRSSIVTHPYTTKRGTLTVVAAAQAAGGATDDPLETYANCIVRDVGGLFKG